MPFPRFENGDVEIRFTEKDEDAYVLHSYVLALHSSWFKASLSERWSGGQATPAPGTRRVYKLQFDKDNSDETLMRTNSVDDTEMQQSIFTSSTGDPPTTELVLARMRCLESHRATIGALYHAPVTFPAPWSLEDKLVDSLVSVADFYGCAIIVKTQIRSYLREEPQRRPVLLCCQRRPYPMLKLGLSLEAD